MDFSSLASSEAVISLVEDHGGPEPYQFELLAPAIVMHKALSLSLSLAFSLSASCQIWVRREMQSDKEAIKNTIWIFKFYEID